MTAPVGADAERRAVDSTNGPDQGSIVDAVKSRICELMAAVPTVSAARIG